MQGGWLSHSLPITLSNICALSEPAPRAPVLSSTPASIARALCLPRLPPAAMQPPGPRRLLLALVALGLLLAPLAEGLRAESAALKRGRKKKKASDARLLNETGRSGADHVQAALQRYISNEELADRLKDLEKRCKGIARLVQIGKSVKGSPLWALEIADHPGQVEPEPAVKYVGNVHGDEPTGRVLTLTLAEWLCANHRSDARAKRIVTSMHLWLVPAMNPDGFDGRTRANANGRDLNRDFPDRFSSPAMEVSGGEQPEVASIMQWTLATGFVASASMHEGALVANYPWDGTPDESTRYEACPDDATFRHLASLYASTHQTMALANNTEFPNGGTTNGAAWYPIYGSMQDWNYIKGRCMELTLELSPSKWPDEKQLPLLWENNRDALLAFPLAAAYGGVWGTVREQGKLRSQKGQELPPLGGANITVVGNNMSVFSREGLGDYYRPLAPGRYTVLVTKEGYRPFMVNLTVPTDGSGAQRHFVLAREGSSSGGEVAYSLKSLGGSGGEGGAEGALPWRSDAAAAGSDSGVPASRARDRLLMLAVGAAVVYGLWLTHSRLQRRTHQRRA
ncbi:hypothetical protein ABPG75_008676 [Micractinium tetrahymenae]